MWRLLPFCLLLAACVSNDPKQSGGSVPTQARVVRTLELPLQPPPFVVEGESPRWTFHDFNVSGSVDEQGFWNIRTEVSHGRIRCATYEVDVQLGK